MRGCTNGHAGFDPFICRSSPVLIMRYMRSGASAEPSGTRFCASPIMSLSSKLGVSVSGRTSSDRWTTVVDGQSNSAHRRRPCDLLGCHHV